MNNTDEWILETLSIHRDWQKPSFYVGNVAFKNGIKMQMSIVLDNASAVKMITLLQDEIVKSAQNLSETLSKSMPIQLEEKNENT